MRLPNLARSPHSRHIPHHVSDRVFFEWLLLTDIGLQTPRLKRLAEIVSAQAMAQQERAEYDDSPIDLDEAHGLAIDGV